MAGSAVKVCTSIGLPGGKSATAAKYAEVKEAIKNGADEIDIPINMELLYKGDAEGVVKDLEGAMAPTKDKAVVKAVIETVGLSQDQKSEAIKAVKRCNTDFITLSTILSGQEHNLEEVKNILRQAAGLKVKAVGGINNLSFASALISAGVERIGTSMSMA